MATDEEELQSVLQVDSASLKAYGDKLWAHLEGVTEKDISLAILILKYTLLRAEVAFGAREVTVRVVQNKKKEDLGGP